MENAESPINETAMLVDGLKSAIDNLIIQLEKSSLTVESATDRLLRSTPHKNNLQSEAHTSELGSPAAVAAASKLDKLRPQGFNKSNDVPVSIIPGVSRMTVLKRKEYKDGESNCTLQFSGTGNAEGYKLFPFHQWREGNTVGLLWRGESQLVKVTTSGYNQMKGLEEHELEHVIWAKAGTEMCKVMGHTLPESAKHGQWAHEKFPGQYWTCHVEIQLLAYVFCKNTMLMLKTEFQGAKPKDVNGYGFNLAESLELYTNLERPEVVLYVSMRPCTTCQGVITAFEMYTGIEVVVYYMKDDEQWKFTTQLEVRCPRIERRKPYMRAIQLGFAEDDEVTDAKPNADDREAMSASEKDGNDEGGDRAQQSDDNVVDVTRAMSEMDV